MKSGRDLVVPIIFLIVGVFWAGLVATGGPVLLLLATIVFVLSGILLIVIPSRWFTRPLAGATALLGLTLTAWQVYQAATLLGSTLNGVGATSAGIFAVFALLCAYLELQTLTMGSRPAPASPVAKKS